MIQIVVCYNPFKALSPHCQQQYKSFLISTLASSYSCQALLVYSYITSESLGEATVSARLASNKEQIGNNLQMQTTPLDVKLIGEKLCLSCLACI